MSSLKDIIVRHCVVTLGMHWANTWYICFAALSKSPRSRQTRKYILQFDDVHCLVGAAVKQAFKFCSLANH